MENSKQAKTPEKEKANIEQQQIQNDEELTESETEKAIADSIGYDYQIVDWKNIFFFGFGGIIIILFLSYFLLAAGLSFMGFIFALIDIFLIRWVIITVINEFYGIKINSQEMIMIFKGKHDADSILENIFPSRKLQFLDMTEIMTIRTQDKVHVSNEGRASVTYNAVLTGKFGSKKFSFSSEDKRNQLFDLIGTFTGMDIY